MTHTKTLFIQLITKDENEFEFFLGDGMPVENPKPFTEPNISGGGANTFLEAALVAKQQFDLRYNEMLAYQCREILRKGGDPKRVKLMIRKYLLKQEADEVIRLVPELRNT